MASTDAYGSMFHTLATRFKQHDHESNARASAQAQADLSKTRSAPTAATYNPARRPSYLATENGAHMCPNCRLLRRNSTVSSTSSAAHSPVTRHVNDDCFGNFCPDIAAPARFNPHDPHRQQHHRRRSSLLPDRDRDSGEDSSTNSYGSPANTDARPSVDPLDQRRCQCRSIKPTENLEERYGREPPR